MAAFDYVDFPDLATRLQPISPSHHTRLAPLTLTPLPTPHPDKCPSTTPPTSPTKTAAMNLIPQILLSSSMQPQQAAAAAAAGQRGGGAPVLLSTRDPLSIPITTVNFRRFVAKSGPMFWVQDRVEEVVMWRKGWKVTAVWMAVYAFLCYFPWLVLLLPHVVLLGIMLSTHPSLVSPTKPAPVPTEGSVDWQTNVQAIQNLMGAFSDFHDTLASFVPHLTYGSSYTPLLLTATLASLLLLLPMLPLLPMRPIFLFLGLTPFFLTHPFTRHLLLPRLFPLSARKALLARVIRAIDDDNLEDKHWRAEMREVELWENERWGTHAGGGPEKGTVGWGKGNLRAGERSAWTRGRDGWSGVQKDGSDAVSSNLTFSLAPSWFFVETEDWRADVRGVWIGSGGADPNGWVYTNDVWLDPKPFPGNGPTRRRRWVRRIYYKP